MNALLHNFEESLREELKCYGGLLALLEIERRYVARSLPDELLATVSAINAQTEAIQAARNERAQRQSQLAQALGMASSARISKLILALPATHRPLVAALVDENNHLLRRVRERAHRNHDLLSRAVGFMEHCIRSVCAPGGPLYNAAGARLQPRPATAFSQAFPSRGSRMAQ
jgi:flagellar FlgN protein